MATSLNDNISHWWLPLMATSLNTFDFETYKTPITPKSNLNHNENFTEHTQISLNPKTPK